MVLDACNRRGRRIFLRFKLTNLPAAEFAERALHKGLRILPTGPDGIRAIPYLNITRAQIEEAIQIIRCL